jgi:threonine dehydrogenase-like Zn-dependent dehydrogenase
MKVRRLNAYGELCLQEKPEPVPVTDEALVRVKVVSVCVLDLHWFSHGGYEKYLFSKKSV